MISLIERGETSPTAAVLSKLASALDVPLATLFDAVPADTPSPLARHSEQACWTDPGSGYQRRHLTPPGLGAPLELVEVTFPAGQSVTFDNATHLPAHLAPHQQLWLLEGRMTLTVGPRPGHWRPATAWPWWSTSPSSLPTPVTALPAMCWR
jgi:transcriptional regulator with XRE-family HTH domain